MIALCGHTPTTGGTVSQHNQAKPLLKEGGSLEKTAPVQPNQPQSFKLMPHKAVYEIELEKSNDPTVKKVTGESTIEIIKTKEGWAYTQNLTVQIHYHYGPPTLIEKNIASWESPTAVSFIIKNSRDGDQELIDGDLSILPVLQGGAELTEHGGWRVYFQEPTMDGFITDYPLVFPIGHLEKILATIEAGGNVLSDQIVFDATHEKCEPIRINTVISPIKDKKIYLKDNLLPSVKLWSVQAAIYDSQSHDPVPNYEESKLEMFSTGVINQMKATWGAGITVVLRLKELTVYK